MSLTDKNGKRIGEKQSAYQNTKTKEEKAAHERHLDNKGTEKLDLYYYRT